MHVEVSPDLLRNQAITSGALIAHAAGGGEVSAPAQPPVGVQQLVDTLLERVRLPPDDCSSGSCSGGGSGGGGSRGTVSKSEPFLFYIDHCFAIKGQGTVMTGEWAAFGGWLGCVLQTGS